MARATEEMIAAYLDGVTELTADERKRVEDLLAGDEAARADAEASRELLGQLRALPGEGAEPDWAALERSIRGAVGPMPRPWWQRWQWLVPIGALAASAAAAMLWLHAAPEHAVPTTTPPVAHAPEQAQPAAMPALVWLDDDSIDVDSIDPGALEVEPAADTLATGDGDALGLDPANDFDWVDQLDDKSLERADTWLAKKKKS